MTSSSRQTLLAELETRSCWTDGRTNAFPRTFQKTKVQHLIFPEASQAYTNHVDFQWVETSGAELMFCQAVFFLKPSQDRMHK